MLVAIDYDDTYTLDPSTWDKVISVLEAGGHEVICVTARMDPTGPYVPLPPKDIGAPVSYPGKIIFTNYRAKRSYLLRQGIRVDVWIDDKPQYIIENHLMLEVYNAR